MEPEPAKYYQRLLHAMVRGMLSERQDLLPAQLSQKHIDELTEEEGLQLLRLAEAQGLPLGAFQRLPALPERLKLLDTIRGISPDNLLDAGCGRGGFIWRLLDEYRNMSITAIDVDPERVAMVAAVSKGGIGNINARTGNIESMPFFPKDSFDATTALRVLEYVDDPERAVAELFRVTKRFLLVQYPVYQATQGNAMTQDALERLLKKHDPMQLKIEQLSNYYIAVVRK
jgi:SAM-dependent methyltransferase